MGRIMKCPASLEREREVLREQHKALTPAERIKDPDVWTDALADDCEEIEREEMVNWGTSERKILTNGLFELAADTVGITAPIRVLDGWRPMAIVRQADWRKPAADQWAMASIASMLPIAYPQVIVAVIQPQHEPRSTSVLYEASEIPHLVRRIKVQLEIAQKPNAKAVGGDHCKYCAARKHCSEAKQ